MSIGRPFLLSGGPDKAPRSLQALKETKSLAGCKDFTYQGKKVRRLMPLEMEEAVKEQIFTFVISLSRREN